MNRKLAFIALVPLVVTGLRAQEPEPAPPEALDIGSLVTKVMGGGPPGASGEAKLPEYKDVIKDMVSKKGLFTLWHYPPEAKDKDAEKLLCEIPAGFLGEKFMLSTSFSGGGFFTGFPLDEKVVQWELLGKQLLLIEPQTGYVIDDQKEVSDVVQRTYPERIRTAVPLVTKSPEGNVVSDLGALLKGDFANIGWMAMPVGPFGAMGRASINASLSKWITPKSFPNNVEIGVELAVSRPAPPGAYDKKRVHFSFWRLPQSDYTPRIADDRVGYFLTANQDWSKPSDARDLFNRYIDRWHLVKRDPSLKLCEPKQPIIFYIEKTVPVRFRRAVRDGILEWNKAYEKIGFVNAVEVRQQEDDNEWADLDPEDMRYSFFRWIVTGAGFAMGPHRANPFTGQIYDADIIFDDSMVRYFEQTADRLLAEEALARKFNDPALRDFLARHPEWIPPHRGEHGILFGEEHNDQAAAAMLERMRHSGRHTCDYMQGMKHQMALAATVLAGAPAEVKEQYLYDIIKEVVMHEVGHTLGLRHNFKASSVFSLEEIKTRRQTGEATVGSVMDYNPALFSADGVRSGHFITPTLGPWDYWVIEYGYRPFDASFTSDAAAKTEEAPTVGDEPPAVPPAKAAMRMDAEQMKQMAQNIPPEVLAQLPPEVKQMIESGDVQALMAQAANMPAPGAPPATPQPKPKGSAFKAAPSGEEKMLAAIAGRAAEPLLAYATDEDTTFVGVDPLSNRFDVSGDPIAWAEDRIQLVNNRIDNVLTWAVKDQESWYHLRQSFLTLMAEKAFVLDYVGRFIGGQYFHRSHRGDADAPEPFVLVDAERQRQALAFIEKNLFQDDFFEADAKVLNHLAPPRWWHQGTFISYTMDFPVHQFISMLQWWNLFDRLFPNTLRRIQDAELKSYSADKFTVAEYLQRIQKACWGDACDARRASTKSWTDSQPFISNVRRSLQREYLNLTEPLVRYQPGAVLSPDLHAMMQFSLMELGDQIDAVLKTGKLDFASKAHLTACKSRIKRMLEPELEEYTSAPGMTMSMGMSANN